MALNFQNSGHLCPSKIESVLRFSNIINTFKINILNMYQTYNMMTGIPQF